MSQIINTITENAKQKLLEKSNQKNRPPSEEKKENFQGLLFIGNRHETVPYRLLTDKYLTPRAKTAWQMIKLNTHQFQGAAFPSYEELALWLSDRAFEGKSISRKLVSQTLLILRLTRWLTLCETVRNSQGQILGNVYVMNDEPLSVMDCLQLNGDYLRLLEKSIKHNDPLIRGIATAMLNELLSQDQQLWQFISHSQIIQSRYTAYKKGLQVATQAVTLPTNIAKAIEQTQQNLLRSDMELSQIDRELSEKMYNLPSSNMELSQGTDTKSLILGLVPNGNLDKQYSTSTNTSIKYCTGENALLDGLALSHLEKKSLNQALMALDEHTAQAVIIEAKQRLAQGGIRKPLGYIFGLIKRAKSGEFNAYWQNKAQEPKSAVQAIENVTQSAAHQLFRATPTAQGNQQAKQALFAELARSLRVV